MSKEFIKNEILKLEKNGFTVNIILITLSYLLITLWLNNIRASAQLWFVWILIIIQFTLYFSIFIKSYKRAITCGLKQNTSLAIFIILAVLGRVNNWEILIIPLNILILLIFSIKTKNISDEHKSLIEKNVR